jgi:hypothetical protein
MKWNWGEHGTFLPLPLIEMAGKRGKAFDRERECWEGKPRVLNSDLEDICLMRESGFAGWMGARNNGGKTSAVTDCSISQTVTLINLSRKIFRPILNPEIHVKRHYIAPSCIVANCLCSCRNGKIIPSSGICSDSAIGRLLRQLSGFLSRGCLGKRELVPG